LIVTDQNQVGALARGVLRQVLGQCVLRQVVVLRLVNDDPLEGVLEALGEAPAFEDPPRGPRNLIIEAEPADQLARGTLRTAPTTQGARKATVLGGLPEAPEGDFLTRAQLAALANRS